MGFFQVTMIRGGGKREERQSDYMMTALNLSWPTLDARTQGSLTTWEISALWFLVGWNYFRTQGTRGKE